MESITFHCKVITPMFLAGADGQTPELRAPSIKGAMRFWWRALNGHLPLHELKEKEDEIFGGTDRRSKFSLRVICDEFDESYEGFNQWFYTYDGNSRMRKGKAFKTNAMYYLGYGVANFVSKHEGTKFIRPYIPPLTKFKVKISTPFELKETVIKAYKTVEQFGGLGSKSRNGFGCFSIEKCEVDGGITQLENIDLKEYTKNRLSSFTAFSDKTNAFHTRKKYPNWELALKELAEAYQYARENIDEWHSWDWRELIAQPIIVKDERRENENPLNRHSKPYFLHISSVGQSYIGEIILLPYEYLKGHEDLKGENEKAKTLRDDYFHALNVFNELLSEKLQHVIANKLN